MKTKEQLQKELNEEYKDLGEITIEKMSKKVVDPTDIEYVDSIMEKVEPLESDEPIVVGDAGWRSYKHIKLIDGYHRLKHALTSDDDIEVFYLDRYELNRNDDTLLSFMKEQVGKQIKFYGNYTFELNDKLYKIKKNEGCGGCGNGWSDLEVEDDLIGKTAKIQSVHSEDGDDYYGDEYDLYINDKLFAKVDTGWGNGYYGGDFDIIR